MSETTPLVDVGKVVDAHGLSRYGVTAILLCMLAMITSGYGLYILAYVIVPLAKHLGVSDAAMTPVVVSQFAGLAVGTYALSPPADYVGRKTVMVSSLALLALSMLFLPFMETMVRLGIVRFLSGVFVSGVMSNAIALATEIVPTERRPSTVGVLFVGFSAGPTIAAAAAAALLPIYGWSTLFFYGGAVTLLLVPVLAWLLPESLRFMVIRRPEDSRIEKMLGRIAPGFRASGRTHYVISGERQRKAAASAVFRDGLASRTLLLWAVFIAVGLDLSLLGAWLPTIMVAGGVSMPRALVLAAIYGGGAICGAFAWSLLADLLNTTAGVLTTALITATCALLAMPWSNLTGWEGSLDMFVVGGSLVGAVTLLSSLAAMLYPTSIRAMGIGWSLGAQNTAGILGPVFGGLMLGASWSLLSVSYVAVGVALAGMLGAGIIWSIQRESPRVRIA